MQQLLLPEIMRQAALPAFPSLESEFADLSNSLLRLPNVFSGRLGDRLTDKNSGLDSRKTLPENTAP
jgi:hypothetical protein